MRGRKKAVKQWQDASRLIAKVASQTDFKSPSDMDFCSPGMRAGRRNLTSRRYGYGRREPPFHYNDPYPHGWRTSLKSSIAALLVIFFASIAAAASNPDGTWRVEDGSGNVKIARCGKAFCGFADDGAPVFQQMKPSGPNAWSGIILDARDNSRYDGTITLLDERTLKVHGCITGGGMCGDQTWIRAR